METITNIKEKFGAKIKKVVYHNEKRVYIDINKDYLIDFVSFIFALPGVRFITASGIDNLNNIEILYHFSFDKEDLVISLRTFLDREDPEIETIVHIIKGALNIEREIYELLGVRFKNHPDLKRFLTDDMLDIAYPLRKDAKKAEK